MIDPVDPYSPDPDFIARLMSPEAKRALERLMLVQQSRHRPNWFRRFWRWFLLDWRWVRR